jgi:hypothetical protein
MAVEVVRGGLVPIYGACPGQVAAILTPTRSTGDDHPVALLVKSGQSTEAQTVGEDGIAYLDWKESFPASWLSIDRSARIRYVFSDGTVGPETAIRIASPGRWLVPSCVCLLLLGGIVGLVRYSARRTRSSSEPRNPRL